MIVNVQTTVSTNLLPVEVDLSEYSDAGEFAAYLYNRSRDFGLIFIPASATIEGLENPLAVATATTEEIWTLHEHTEEHGQAFGMWLSSCGEPSSDISDWGFEFQDAFHGEHSSLEEWAQDHMETFHGDLYTELDNSGLLNYFDFESWAERELTHGFTWADSLGAVFVFANL